MDNQQNIYQRVEAQINKGFNFPFESVFENVWYIFKKATLPMAGAILLLAVPMMIIYVIMMPFMFGISSFNQYMEIIQDNPYYLQELQRSPAYLLKQSLFGLIIALLFAPINAGCLQLCRDADKTGEVKFGTIFSFYKGKYLGRLMLVMVITTVVQNGLSIALNFIPIIGQLTYLLLIIVMYVMIIYVQPLIVFADASVGDSFALSFKLAAKSFLPVLGYGLLFGLLFFLGIFACCIGAIFTAAFLPAYNYVMYKRTVGFPEDDEAMENQGHWQDQPPVQ